MSKIFVTSDLHFGHQNIIKFSKRPFINVKEMDDTIIKNWNETVSQNDLVYILGDFCYQRDSIESYLRKLNGKKILIIGNHDPKYKINGLLYSTNYEELKIENKKYVLFHYQLHEWNGKHKGTIHLYGHLHASSGEQAHTNIKNSYNVNCEFHNYKPVEIKNFK